MPHLSPMSWMMTLIYLWTLIPILILIIKPSQRLPLRSLPCSYVSARMSSHWTWP